MAYHFLTQLERQVTIARVAWISANKIAIGLRYGWIEIWEIEEDIGTSQLIKRFRHGAKDLKNASRFMTIFYPFSTPVAVIDLQWNERTKYLASSSLNGTIKAISFIL